MPASHLVQTPAAAAEKVPAAHSVSSLAPVGQKAPVRLPVPVGYKLRAWHATQRRWLVARISGGRRIERAARPYDSVHLYDVELLNVGGTLHDLPIHYLRHGEHKDHEAPDARSGKTHPVYLDPKSYSRVFKGPTPWRYDQMPLAVFVYCPRNGVDSVKKEDQKGSFKYHQNEATKKGLRRWLSKNLDCPKRWHEHLDPKLFKQGKDESSNVTLPQFKAPSCLARITEPQAYDIEHTSIKHADCFEVFYWGHMEHEFNWAMENVEQMMELGYVFRIEPPQLRAMPYYS